MTPILQIVELRCMEVSDCPEDMESKCQNSNSEVLVQNPPPFPSSVFSPEPPLYKSSVCTFLKSLVLENERLLLTQRRSHSLGLSLLKKALRWRQWKGHFHAFSFENPQDVSNTNLEG